MCRNPEPAIARSSLHHNLPFNPILMATNPTPHQALGLVLGVFRQHGIRADEGLMVQTLRSVLSNNPQYRPEDIQAGLTLGCDRGLLELRPENDMMIYLTALGFRAL